MCLPVIGALILVNTLINEENLKLNWIIIRFLCIIVPVPVEARSEANAIIAWTLRLWVRIPLKA
jgi:hypothetical protein